MCVVAGEIPSQSVSIAAGLRAAGFIGAVYLEMTEQEAIKKSSLDAIVANASRFGVMDLLERFVYLTRTKQSPGVLEFETTATAQETDSMPALVPPTANDVEAPPQRIDVQITRIIRDTQAARDLKSLYEYRCQICGFRIEPKTNQFYAEVHHVQPLGGGHNGLDIISNMLVLCPNHHAMFDFGAVRFISEDTVKIARRDYSITVKHKLAPESIAYHNDFLSHCISD
jgi:predicted restriction endonuclease